MTQEKAKAAAVIIASSAGILLSIFGIYEAWKILAEPPKKES